MDAAENPLIRRHLLEILQDAVNRQRGPGDDITTYVAESLLQRMLSLRGFALPMERMRGQLYWCKDKGYAKFRETRVGLQKFIAWRITATGSDVLEGTTADRGVAGE